jgi:hypothetical protein
MKNSVGGVSPSVLKNRWLPIAAARRPLWLISKVRDWKIGIPASLW